MFVTGILLIPVGTLTAAVGGIMLAISAGASSVAGTEATGSATGVSAAILGGGGALLVGGIVMVVVGGKKVPVESTTALDLSPRQPKATLEPLFGPTSAGVRVRF